MKLLARILPLLPALVLLLHAAVYGRWIVDDAGIVYAYARNWAEGFGLTAFPGDPPVEGFTSPLAVVLFAASMKAGVFHTVWTAKLLGLSSMLGAFFVLRGVAVRTFPVSRRWIDVGLLLAATSPPLVVWTVSGLENPLYALAVTLLLAWTVRTRDPSPRDACIAGALAGAIPLVRPDGLVFAALWPLVVFLGTRREFRARLGLAFLGAMVTVAMVALLTWWRWEQFGDVVPHTFHAKRERMELEVLRAAAMVLVPATVVAILARHARSRRTTWGLAAAGVVAIGFWIEGANGALRALAGPTGPLVFGLLLASPVWAKPNPARLPWYVSTLLGLFAFVCMPGDWMGEYRFATPFLLVTTVWAGAELGPAVASARRPRLRLLLTTAGVLACVGLLGRNVSHALDYRARPALPFSTVELHFRQTFDRWNRDLGLEGADALLSDIGGALWTRTVHVRDLAGLCDPDFVRLTGGTDEMRAFILDELRPAFIRIHGPWAVRSALPGDPQFEQDYVAVLEIGDTGWGDFVRRDLVPDPSLIDRWRRDAGR